MLSALLSLAALLLVLALLAFWMPPRYRLPSGGFMYAALFTWWWDPNSDDSEI